MTGSDNGGADESHDQQITRARRVLEQARSLGQPTAVAAAQQALRAVVEAARDAGVTWTQIGKLLGIARGNAYQRYRRRPTRSGDAAP